MKCSVGEPWDFSSSDGDNIILGVITKISSDGRELTISTAPFQIKEITYSDLKIRARYETDRDLIRFLLLGKNVPINAFSDLNLILAGTLSLIR